MMKSDVTAMSNKDLEEKLKMTKIAQQVFQMELERRQKNDDDSVINKMIELIGLKGICPSEIKKINLAFPNTFGDVSTIGMHIHEN